VREMLSFSTKSISCSQPSCEKRSLFKDYSEYLLLDEEIPELLVVEHACESLGFRGSSQL